MVDVSAAAAAYLRHLEERRNREHLEYYTGSSDPAPRANSTPRNGDEDRFVSQNDQVRTLHIASVGSGMGWASTASASVLAFEAIMSESANFEGRRAETRVDTTNSNKILSGKRIRSAQNYAAMSSSNGNYECSICLENMKDAVETPCSHWFCRDCLFTLLTYRGESGNNVDPVCALCRHPLKNEKVWLQKHGWAAALAALPKNRRDDTNLRRLERWRSGGADIRLQYGHQLRATMTNERTSSSGASEQTVVPCCFIKVLEGEIFSNHQLIRKVTIEFQSVTRDGRYEPPVTCSLVRPPFEIPFDTRDEAWVGKRVRCSIHVKFAFGLGLSNEGLRLSHEIAPCAVQEADIRSYTVRRTDRDTSEEGRARAQRQQLNHLTSMQRNTGRELSVTLRRMASTRQQLNERLAELRSGPTIEEVRAANEACLRRIRSSRPISLPETIPAPPLDDGSATEPGSTREVEEPAAITVESASANDLLLRAAAARRRRANELKAAGTATAQGLVVDSEQGKYSGVSAGTGYTGS